MKQHLLVPVERPVWVLAAVLGLCLVSVAQLVDLRTGAPRLTIDSSFDALMPSDGEERAFYNDVVERFGSDDHLLVVLVDDDDIFTAENLARVRAITEEIEAHAVVRSVVSLSTALNIRADGQDLAIEPFFEDVPTTEAELAEVRRRALSDPIYAGNLVSPTGRATAIVVKPLPLSEFEFVQSGLDEAVSRIARDGAGDAEVWITGGAHIKAEMNRVLFADLARVVPFATLLMMIVAYISFRSIRGVILPLTAVGIAVLWTLGILSATAGSMNLVTTSLPAILLVVGFAYTVHVMSAYYAAIAEDHARPQPTAAFDPAGAALGEVFLPVVLTGVTTAAGFFSLATSRLAAIQQFGLIAGVGVLCAAASALTFAPAVLALLGEPRRVATRSQAPEPDLLDRLLGRLAHVSLERRPLVFALAGILAVVSALGIPRIVVNTDFVRNFPPDNRARIDFEAVNEVLEGSNVFYVVLDTDYSDAFLEPSNLREVEELQAWLVEQPEIGGTTSLVDYLKTISRGFFENDPTSFAIPDSTQLIAKLFLFGANDELADYVDSRYQTAKIAVRTQVIDTRDLGALADRVEARLATLPARLRARVTGNTVLVSRTLDEIALGQALSLGTAFVIIYLMLAGLFTSWRIGLVALLPNALPVLTYFGILGWSGVHLNTTTGLVACMVLGIAVDDTIHYLAHFNRAAKASADEREGATEALRTVGRPVTFTTAALCLGFLAISQSELQSQAQFGLLAATTLVVAWLIDVTLTPALASGMRVVTLWDVLTLDLGEHPEESIPLFRGLSRTQARIVALMTDLRVYPKGYPLLRVGDAGSEMFVVIDGVLRASIDGAEGPVILRNHARGDTFGEIAQFEGRRTANVETLSEVRLLSLDQSSLERLRRRYPRISAQLYRNLSTILAERLKSVTDQMRQPERSQPIADQ